MIAPIITFSMFISLVFVIIYYGNKSRQKEYDDLVRKLNGNIKLFIEQTHSSNMTWGLKNSNYLFNKCDIYLTENAIVIFGYSKKSIFKQLSIPIILTNEISFYNKNFSYAYVKKINSIKSEDSIILKFGEKGITETEVTIKLNNLTEIQKSEIIKTVNSTPNS